MSHHHGAQPLYTQMSMEVKRDPSYRRSQLIPQKKDIQFEFGTGSSSNEAKSEVTNNNSLYPTRQPPPGLMRSQNKRARRGSNDGNTNQTGRRSADGSLRSSADRQSSEVRYERPTASSLLRSSTPKEHSHQKSANSPGTPASIASMSSTIYGGTDVGEDSLDQTTMRAFTEHLRPTHLVSTNGNQSIQNSGLSSRKEAELVRARVIEEVARMNDRASITLEERQKLYQIALTLDAPKLARRLVRDEGDIDRVNDHYRLGTSRLHSIPSADEEEEDFEEGEKKGSNVESAKAAFLTGQLSASYRHARDERLQSSTNSIDNMDDTNSEDNLYDSDENWSSKGSREWKVSIDMDDERFCKAVDEVERIRQRILQKASLPLKEDIMSQHRHQSYDAEVDSMVPLKRVSFQSIGITQESSNTGRKSLLHGSNVHSSLQNHPSDSNPNDGYEVSKSMDVMQRKSPTKLSAASLQQQSARQRQGPLPALRGAGTGYGLLKSAVTNGDNSPTKLPHSSGVALSTFSSSADAYEENEGNATLQHLDIPPIHTEETAEEAAHRTAAALLSNSPHLDGQPQRTGRVTTHSYSFSAPSTQQPPSTKESNGSTDMMFRTPGPLSTKDDGTGTHSPLVSSNAQSPVAISTPPDSRSPVMTLGAIGKARSIREQKKAQIQHQRSQRFSLDRQDSTVSTGSQNSTANSEYGQQRQVTSALDTLIGSRANSRTNLMKAPQKSFRLKNLAQLQKQLEEAMRINRSSGPSSNDLDENNDLSQLGAYLNSQNDTSGFTDATDDHSEHTPEDAGDDIEPTPEEINERRQRYTLAFNRFRSQHSLKAPSDQTAQKDAPLPSTTPLTMAIDAVTSSFDEHLEYGAIRLDENDNDTDNISLSFPGLKDDSSVPGTALPGRSEVDKNQVNLKQSDSHQPSASGFDESLASHSFSGAVYEKKDAMSVSSSGKPALVKQMTVGSRNSKNSESTDDSFFNWSPAVSRQGTQTSGLNISNHSQPENTGKQPQQLRVALADNDHEEKKDSREEQAQTTMEAAIAAAIVAGKDPRDLMDMMIGNAYQAIIDSPSPSKARQLSNASPKSSKESAPKSGRFSPHQSDDRGSGCKLQVEVSDVKSMDERATSTDSMDQWLSRQNSGELSNDDNANDDRQPDLKDGKSSYNLSFVDEEVTSPAPSTMYNSPQTQPSAGRFSHLYSGIATGANYDSAIPTNDHTIKMAAKRKNSEDDSHSNTAEKVFPTGAQKSPSGENSASFKAVRPRGSPARQPMKIHTEVEDLLTSDPLRTDGTMQSVLSSASTVAVVQDYHTEDYNSNSMRQPLQLPRGNSNVTENGINTPNGSVSSDAGSGPAPTVSTVDSNTPSSTSTSAISRMRNNAKLLISSPFSDWLNFGNRSNSSSGNTNASRSSNYLAGRLRAGRTSQIPSSTRSTDGPQTSNLNTQQGTHSAASTPGGYFQHGSRQVYKGEGSIPEGSIFVSHTVDKSNNNSREASMKKKKFSFDDLPTDLPDDLLDDSNHAPSENGGGVLVTESDSNRFIQERGDYIANAISAAKAALQAAENEQQVDGKGKTTNDGIGMISGDHGDDAVLRSKAAFRSGRPPSGQNAVRENSSSSLSPMTHGSNLGAASSMSSKSIGNISAADMPGTMALLAEAEVLLRGKQEWDMVNNVYKSLSVLNGHISQFTSPASVSLNESSNTQNKGQNTKAGRKSFTDDIEDSLSKFHDDRSKCTSYRGGGDSLQLQPLVIKSTNDVNDELDALLTTPTATSATDALKSNSGLGSSINSSRSQRDPFPFLTSEQSGKNDSSLTPSYPTRGDSPRIDSLQYRSGNGTSSGTATPPQGRSRRPSRHRSIGADSLTSLSSTRSDRLSHEYFTADGTVQNVQSKAGADSGDSVSSTSPPNPRQNSGRRMSQYRQDNPYRQQSTDSILRMGSNDSYDSVDTQGRTINRSAPTSLNNNAGSLYGGRGYGGVANVGTDDNTDYYMERTSSTSEEAENKIDKQQQRFGALAAALEAGDAVGKLMADMMLGGKKK